jgi:hypothetical protein
MIGSTEMNRPVVGSYCRAPRVTRPVLSWRPLTKPRLVGHAARGVRALPKGSVFLRVAASVVALMLS